MPNTALPLHPLQIIQQIDLDESFGPSDPRWVNFDDARGQSSPTLPLMARKFGLDLKTGDFFPRGTLHALLFGPIGCGKSTELRRFAEVLSETGQPHSQKLLPIVLNVRGEMDINNLRYVDVLMALAKALVEHQAVQGLNLPTAAIEPLYQWFVEHVATEEKLTDLTAELRTEAHVGLSIPFVGKLLARFSAVAKNSSVYKTAIRDVTQKTFSQFAGAFNQLVLRVEEALTASGAARRVLFVVDGTDKITPEDAQRLFLTEAEQLLAITSLVVYTAPIGFKYGGASHSKLDTDLILSINKIKDVGGHVVKSGMDAMRAMLNRRVNMAVFDTPELFDLLIEASGGHPRELLKLLCMACELTETNTLSAATIQSAIDKHAGEFRYWLQSSDYALLAQIDTDPTPVNGADEAVHKLLWRLALLHYNDGSWRASNPVVRRLREYKLAVAALAAASSAVATRATRATEATPAAAAPSAV